MTAPVPQDDLPAEQFGDDCACEFTPYDDSDEESWHYLRRCSCGSTFWSTHCRCEQPRRKCGACKQ